MGEIFSREPFFYRRQSIFEVLKYRNFTVLVGIIGLFWLILMI